MINFADVETIAYFIIYSIIVIMDIYFVYHVEGALIKKLKAKRPLEDMRVEIGIIFSLISVLILFGGILKSEYYRIPAVIMGLVNPMLVFGRRI